MNDDTKATLDSLERLLLADATDPRPALEAAYRIGEIEGMLKVSGQVANYADAAIRRDKIARLEGRPEHDLDTFGRPLKAGS